MIYVSFFVSDLKFSVHPGMFVQVTFCLDTLSFWECFPYLTKLVLLFYVSIIFQTQFP